MGTEIDDKTLNGLTDRWFAKQQWNNEIFENARFEDTSNCNFSSFIL